MTKVLKFRKKKKSDVQAVVSGEKVYSAPAGHIVRHMFDVGMDTFDIAAHFQCPEHVILQVLNQRRSDDLGLEDPYRMI